MAAETRHRSTKDWAGQELNRSAGCWGLKEHEGSCDCILHDEIAEGWILVGVLLTPVMNMLASSDTASFLPRSAGLVCADGELLGTRTVVP